MAGALLGAPAPIRAANTIFFGVNDAGVDKSVETWGVDTAWPSFDNVRLSFANIGQSNVDVVRIIALADQPLVNLGGGNYELNAAAKATIDGHLSLAAMAGTNPTLTIGVGGVSAAEIDPMYVSGGGMNVANYVQLFKATQAYVNSQPGFTSSQIFAIEPFNEPDFNFPNANPADLNSTIQQLKTIPAFQNTLMMAPSTLNSDNAQWWYDQVAQATAGSSHLLGGSLTSWRDFIQHVNNTGKTFVNPELHSLGEMIVGAEYGMSMGIIWAEVLRGRGTFIQASDGDRLGYFEDLGRQSAAAVYRAPDGEIYAFAGGLERDYQGTPTAYRFVSTDEDVYFNGIPVREYMLQTDVDRVVSATDNDFANYGSWSHEGSYAEIKLDDSGVPALDGRRWKIQNEQTKQFMEVVGGGTGDGALIRSARNAALPQQQWNIVRTRNGYFELYNENSGRTAEVAGSSLAEGASVRQWGTADNWTQQWFIEPAGDRAFYIRNANSGKYLTSDSVSSKQYDLTGSDLQKWRFVAANPTHGPVAHYEFNANTLDAVGTQHGTALGSPSYGLDRDLARNRALVLDGADDYVQLPAGVASSADITVSAWVRWDGGGDWQRVFDFGNDTTSYMFLTPRSGDGFMRFAITNTGSQAEQLLDTDPLPTGEWVHLAVALGGNTGVLYVNGEPRVAGQILLDPADIDPLNNYIGASQWPDPTFDGSIDDFRIYDYALDMWQIAELVNGPDADHDGDVDGADFLLLQQSNPAALTAWSAQYGQASSATALTAAVPEPASSAVALLAIAIGARAITSGRR